MSKQFYLLSIQQRLFQAKMPSIVASSALAGMVAMSTVHDSNNANPTTTQSDSSPPSSSSSSPTPSKIIETDFLEKIASKSYLNYHNPFARDSIITSALNTSKKVWNKLARNDISPSPAVGIGDYFDKDNVMKVVGGSKQLYERPKGVPRRIRIMAIDVPEFRQVFDGECRVNLSRVYPDGIAPSKYVQRKKEEAQSSRGSGSHGASASASAEDGNSSSSSSDASTSNTPSNDGKKIKKKKKKDKDDEIEIIQKSLARSLVRCRNVQSKRIGVELLESSVYDLNPHNMRRTYQFGSYRYDPGKYGSMKKIPGDDMLQRRITAYGGVPRDVIRKQKGRDTDRDVVVTKNKKQQDVDDEDRALGDVEDVTDQDEKTTVLANDEDEVDAPWNQYAWIEEMELRIHGRIPFGASVERTSWFTRKLFGKNFRSTVKATASSPLLWFVPSFVIGHRPGGYDGIDGDYGKKKRTVNRASSKPHAVIADGSAMQRVPGSLRYLTKCCQEADVPLFIINDPRVWGGNTHIDLESAAKDMRKTIKARIVANALTIKEGSMFERGRILGKLETETKWQIKDAGRRTREAVQSAAARLQREREENWNELSSEELLERLIERQILQNEGGKIRDIGTREAFAELCRQFVINEEKAKQQQQQQQQQQHQQQQQEQRHGQEQQEPNIILKDKANGNENHDNNDEKENDDKDNGIDKQKI